MFSRRSQRLLLRPVLPEDRAEFVRIHTLSQTHFAPWSPAVDPAKSLEDHFDQLLSDTIAGLQSGRALKCVAERDDGRLVGFYNLNNIVMGAFHNAYASWRTSVDCIRQGLGTEAVTTLLDLAFAERPHGLGLHRVQANVIPSNTASTRLAERVGFRREGLALRYLKIAGVWQDHIMFARLSDEHEIQSLPA